MFYVDSRLTITRRDSSLISSYANQEKEDDVVTLANIGTGSHLIHRTSISEHSLIGKPKAKLTVEEELITSFFEAMLGTIVESWTVLENKVESLLEVPVISELGLVSQRPKKSSSRTGKIRSRTKLVSDNATILEMKSSAPICWWSGPDEKVRIQFRNGNTYEGNISLKCMHGEGKFRWASGVSYMGQYFYNELRGRGFLEWRNQSWYEGDFEGSMRHGKGIFVDSNDNFSYIGNWYCGTKDGQGALCYSSTSSYDGSWEKNIRNGSGAREYCLMSGYNGNWNNYVREGQGTMIWPIHDFYNGEWKDGVMSGYGFYVWGICANGTMSIPSHNSYNGFWKNGLRHGNGILRFGFANGSHYKGQFYENRKHGKGSLVTGDGYIMQGQQLFVDDNLASVAIENEGSTSTVEVIESERPQFDMCAASIDFWYHIDQAIKVLDTSEEEKDKIMNLFLKANIKSGKTAPANSKQQLDKAASSQSKFQINFEYQALQKAVRCYETNLKEIYYQYATVCNATDITFNPILIRLYMWQMYYDCNIHEKGITLVEIDDMLYRNPAWLMKSKHDPFERVYYWQFLHSLITVSSKLYSKKHLPTNQFDTIIACAFRKCMTDDILPHVGHVKGTVVKACMSHIPLNAIYKLYKSIGEPHTIRDFLKATRYQPHWINVQQPALVEASDEVIYRGKNAFLIGDQIAFVTEKSLLKKEITETSFTGDLKLLNLGNLSSKTVIKNFASIFLNVQVNNKITNLDIQLTFLEFYDVLLICFKESAAANIENEKWEESQDLPINTLSKKLL